MVTWQFWIIAALLASIAVTLVIMGEQLKAINKLLIDVANGIEALVHNSEPEPDDD